MVLHPLLITAERKTQMTKENSNQALFEAIEAGDLEKVKALIDAGADVNAYEDGITPLFRCQCKRRLGLASAAPSQQP